MPYNSWVQFRRQLVFGRSASWLAQAQSGVSNIRPLIHSQWNHHDTYSPASVPFIGALPAWVQNNSGIVTIQTAGVSREVLDGIRNYGAFLDSIIQPRIIKATAGGAVIHDRTTDKLYYAASRWVQGMYIHATLAARTQQLPIVQGIGGVLIHTWHPNRHAQTCAEFQALNQALPDGAVKQNLDLWCFRARTMKTLPTMPKLSSHSATECTGAGMDVLNCDCTTRGDLSGAKSKNNQSHVGISACRIGLPAAS